MPHSIPFPPDFLQSFWWHTLRSVPLFMTINKCYSTCHLLWGAGIYQFSNRIAYWMLTLIFKVSTRTHATSTLFGNLGCNVYFKCQSAHIKMFMLCLLHKWMYACDMDSYSM
jgi:predicted ferric reductase